MRRAPARAGVDPRPPLRLGHPTGERPVAGFERQERPRSCAAPSCYRSSGPIRRSHRGRPRRSPPAARSPLRPRCSRRSSRKRSSHRRARDSDSHWRRGRAGSCPCRAGTGRTGPRNRHRRSVTARRTARHRPGSGRRPGDPSGTRRSRPPIGPECPRVVAQHGQPQIVRHRDSVVPGEPAGGAGVQCAPCSTPRPRRPPRVACSTSPNVRQAFVDVARPACASAVFSTGNAVVMTSWSSSSWFSGSGRSGWTTTPTRTRGTILGRTSTRSAPRVPLRRHDLGRPRGGAGWRRSAALAAGRRHRARPLPHPRPRVHPRATAPRCGWARPPRPGSSRPACGLGGSDWTVPRCPGGARRPDGEPLPHSRLDRGRRSRPKAWTPPPWRRPSSSPLVVPAAGVALTGRLLAAGRLLSSRPPASPCTASVGDR